MAHGKKSKNLRKRKKFEQTSFNELSENKGLNFYGAEKKKRILEIAKELDKNYVEYSLADILAQDLEKKIIVFHDKVPSFYFYWNVQNKIDRDEFGENVNFKIRRFDKEVLYDGYNSAEAIAQIEPLNKIIQVAEKKIFDLYKLKAYPSIAIYESESKEGDELKTESVQIDYAQAQTKLPQDYEKEFLDMLPGYSEKLPEFVEIEKEPEVKKPVKKQKKATKKTKPVIKTTKAEKKELERIEQEFIDLISPKIKTKKDEKKALREINKELEQLLAKKSKLKKKKRK